MHREESLVCRKRRAAGKSISLWSKAKRENRGGVSVMTKQEIERINFLAAKSKTVEGLTGEEKEEQASLRKRYIEDVKASLRAQLDSAEVQNADGSVTPLQKRGES